MKKYTFKILDFLSGSAVIKVRDPQDFKALKDTLSDMGLLGILVRKPEENNLQHWRYIASINRHLGIYCGYEALFFEYRSDKGLTFSWDERKAIDWWGKEMIYSAKQVRSDFLEKEVEHY